MKSYSDALPNIEKEVVTRTLDESVKAREIVELIHSHLDETHEDIRQLAAHVTETANQIETSLVEIQSKVDSLAKRTNYLVTALVVEFIAVVFFAGVVTGYIPLP